MDASSSGQDLVRALLRDQHPDLADLELRDDARTRQAKAQDATAKKYLFPKYN